MSQLKIEVHDSLNFASHQSLFTIGWQDLQIVRQLSGRMTNTWPANFSEHNASSKRYQLLPWVNTPLVISNG
jgi:hypothetical protein